MIQSFPNRHTIVSNKKRSKKEKIKPHPHSLKNVDKNTNPSKLHASTPQADEVGLQNSRQIDLPDSAMAGRQQLIKYNC